MSHSFGKQTILALLLALVASAATRGADDLVQQVRDGHRAARESIRTLTANMTIEIVYPKQSIFWQSRYWRSGNTARHQYGEEGKKTGDSLMKDGEIRTLGRKWSSGKPTPEGNALRRPATAGFGLGDAWGEMMFEFPGEDSGQMNLDRLLETAASPIRADRDRIDGRDCIRLRYSHKRGTSEERTTQWHDIGRNYLIYKLTTDWPDDPSLHHGVVQALDFLESEPGVFLPVRVRRESYKRGVLSTVRITILSDVVVNKPLPQKSLEFPFTPRGTILTDQIENKKGPIDSDWNPIGEMKSLGPRIVPPAERAPVASPTFGAPSTSEPVSSARLVIGGSIALILVAAALSLFRRIRLKRSIVE